MIRELHVLGKHTDIGTSRAEYTQHQGYGKRLVSLAEQIASRNGYGRMSVISGIGVREYYRKLGYHENTTYMMKDLNYQRLVGSAEISFFIPAVIMILAIIASVIIIKS